LLGLAALLAPSATAESSPSAYGDRLVSLINQARADQGLHALTVTSGTSGVAANWTQHLDSQQALSHNPNLGPQLEAHGSPNWTAYGENVGKGPTSSADDVFKAYMNSPEHRDNILNARYRYLGIGVLFDGSTAWNTLDFVDQYSTSKPRAATHQTTPKTTPKTTPRTTTKTAPAPRPAVRLPHTVARPAAHPHTQVHRPVVRAVAKPATVAPAAAPAAPAPKTSPVAVAMPAPLQVPGRDTAPFAAAAAMILLVVSTRYLVEVFPRRA
jgi:hypothetical protein